MATGPGGRVPTAARCTSNPLQTKDLLNRPDDRHRSPTMPDRWSAPLNCGFQTEKSQRYDVFQGLPSQGAFWQEKGR